MTNYDTSDWLCDMKWQSENIPGMWLYDSCLECDGRDPTCEYRAKNMINARIDAEMTEADIREAETLAIG